MWCVYLYNYYIVFAGTLYIYGNNNLIKAIYIQLNANMTLSLLIIYVIRLRLNKLRETATYNSTRVVEVRDALSSILFCQGLCI